MTRPTCYTILLYSAIIFLLFLFREPRKLFGSEFYFIYKNAVFLTTEGTVVKLLAMGHELREKLETLEPGQTLVVEGVNLWRE